MAAAKRSERKKVAGKAARKAKRVVAKSKTRRSTARKKPMKRKTTQVKKQLRSLRKGLTKDAKAASKARKTAQRAVARTRALDVELDKLKKQLTRMRKQPKTSRKQLNEYNLFIRRHIRKGKTFSQAATLWKRLRRIEQQKRPARARARPAVRARRKSAIKRKVRPKARKKVRKKKVPRKKKSPRKKKAVRAPIVRRKISRITPAPAMGVAQLQDILKQTVYALSAQSEANTRQLARQVEEAIDRIPVSTDAAEGTVPSDEEAAFNIVKMYYAEVARLGHKRQLTLDEVIDAYLYALSRVQRKQYEMGEIATAIGRRNITR